MCGTTSKQGTNILTIEEKMHLVSEKDTGQVYARQKPVQLYTELINLFSNDKYMYVIDACSGAGSCALACSAAKKNCIVIEKSSIKARLIRQRADVV